ncbi:uncharacterized protein K441DRAFT_707608 [Cenococcum geophilum 1.58]|uniref:uncharacterized protein n=1 Tax=Cenococcum geophilum 1.58 TaxID=794803 RepID=UPI00358F4661|nr:hypothetical protein K441DRAFT_707608 [Cenococcum geophilum 1.58]
MDKLFQKIFTSDQFTFFVGEDKKPIVVHAAAIADQSPALNVLINGQMTEAQTGSAIFNDVLEEDFIRFCQFAYTGDYTPPMCIIEDETSHPTQSCPLESDSEPEILDAPPTPPALEEIRPEEPEEPEPEPVLEPEPQGAWYSRGSYSQTHRISQASRKVNLRRSFDIKFICSTLPQQRIINSCEAIPNSHAKQDYTGVFLAHARLYVFADKYGIEPLESLSLHKLHATLKSFTLYRARVGDILKLVRYAYENGPGYKSNKLRALVSEYIACEIDTIGGTKRFFALMEEGGLFVRDFWKLVQKNLL